MADWPEFVTEKQRCPACKRVHDRSTAVQHDCAPKAGDLTICSRCAAYLRFGEGLELLPLSAAEWAALDVEIRIEMRRVREAIKEARRA